MIDRQVREAELIESAPENPEFSLRFTRLSARELLETQPLRVQDDLSWVGSEVTD